MISFGVPLSQFQWRRMFPFTFSWTGHLGFCIMLGVEGISNRGEGL